MERFAEDACMMARRSYRAESIPKPFFHDGINSLNNSTCSQQRCLPGLFTASGVLTIKHGDLLVSTSFKLSYVLYHFQDVVEIMHFQNIADLRFFRRLSDLKIIL